ncbi:recombinase [[Haemophilus] ducreyi]|uniref:site-specific recombinase n=1 Tax=Haemophilus ducreyi TaxID=730 RepID=UPI0007CDD2C6|nr:site-specific recombinase [[Haemophilus] ducreyi]ANF61722.1 recombinase [[Haemophilus] ducreyi]ANF67972.1 recombinase [[Haemophilus] ducreyi]ANF69467.1 recombinase [[Haemophilus] ducreyi]
MAKMYVDEQKLPAFIEYQVQQNDAFALLSGICKWLRKGSPHQAAAKLDFFTTYLKQQPAVGQAVATLLCRWLCKMRLYPILVSGGILGREGFGREMRHRLYEKINPAFKDVNDLRDVFFLLFRQRKDMQWMNAIPNKYWLSLLHCLDRFVTEQDRNWLYDHIRHEGFFAIKMLSIWIAAEDLEPELIRLDPTLLDADSPFVALQKEVGLWLNARHQHQYYDDSHLHVMLTQSRELVGRLQKKGETAGSSMGVAYLLERLCQTLDRLAMLMDLLAAKRVARLRVLKITKMLAEAAANKHSISDLWKQSIKMLSRSITQQTSDHGEHYITRDKKEYFSMFFSAAGGGVLIALMALFKIYLGHIIDDKVWKGVAEGLNYGIGFAIIFMLHFTVATKQPAMTASRFAEAVERNSQGRAVNMKLAQLLVDVLRSQSAAVFGNVLVSVSVSAGIAYLYASHMGQPLLTSEMVQYQLHSIDPTQGTLWFAAIAGLWLFCSGIISGYFDNRSNYLNTRMRLRQHPVLKLLLPQRLRECLADYIHDNSGSIIGNICFGMLLGLTGVIGYWLDLPLDIRHVAFSSANVGYAVVSEELGWQIFMQSLGFVLLIGVVNLIVSFSLTLWVALRSRNTEIDSWTAILKCICEIVRKRPLSLLLPFQLHHK